MTNIFKLKLFSILLIALFSPKILYANHGGDIPGCGGPSNKEAKEVWLKYRNSDGDIRPEGWQRGEMEKEWTKRLIAKIRGLEGWRSPEKLERGLKKELKYVCSEVSYSVPKGLKMCISHYSNDIQAGCKAYFRQNVLKDILDTLKQEEIARKRKKEQALQARKDQEKKKKEKERKKKENEKKKAELVKKNKKLLNSAFQEIVRSDISRIIWGGSNKQSENSKKFKSPIKALNEINVVYSEEVARLSGKGSEFVPPAKGEFEKTKEYNQRLKLLHDKHNKSIKALSEKAQLKDAEIFAKHWNKKFGLPELIILSYDADNERFTVVAGKSKWKSVAGFLAAPIKTAKDLKPKLETSSLWVVFEKKKAILSAKAIVFQAESGDILVIDKVKGSVPLEFTQERASAYRLDIKKKDEKAKAAAIDKKVKERASWPKGAKAKIEASAFLCSSVRSATKYWAIERANNSYATLPEDCLILPGPDYAVRIRYLNNGLVKVRMIGATINGYTIRKYIEEY